MRFSKELRVALLALVAVTFLWFGYRFLRGTDFFSSVRTYYAEYDNVEGLAVSSPVVDNGVKVGIVKAVELKQDRLNRVRVTLEVDKKLEIGDSTIAVMTSSSLLGGKLIDLHMGRNSRRFEGGETLKSFAPQSITDMLSAKAQPLIGRVDSTLVKLNAMFNADTKKSIQATLANTEAMTESLKQMMAQNQRNIAIITANMSDLTTSFKGTARKLDQLSGNMLQMSDSLKRVNIGRLVRELDSTATVAHRLVAKINSNNGSLGKLMNDDSLYTNLNHSSAALDALLVDFKANPKRYVSFSVFSKSRVAEATSVTGNDKVIIKKAGTVDTSPPKASK